MSCFRGLNLTEVLAQIVEYATDDFRGSEPYKMSEDVVWSTGYVCSCFIAQHTTIGHDEGVDTETSVVGLKIGEDINFQDRLKFAKSLVDSFEQKENEMSEPASETLVATELRCINCRFGRVGRGEHIPQSKALTVMK